MHRKIKKIETALKIRKKREIERITSAKTIFQTPSMNNKILDRLETKVQIDYQPQNCCSCDNNCSG